MLHWHNTNPVEISSESSEFQIKVREVSNAEDVSLDEVEIYSTLKTVVVLGRKGHSHFFRLYGPSFAIVLVSWLALFLDGEKIPSRLTIHTGCITALITQWIGLYLQLPTVSYLRAVEVWMITHLLILVASLFADILSTCMSRKEREEGNEVRPAESDTIMQGEEGNEVGPAESDTIMQGEEGNEVRPAESDTIMQEEEGNEVGPAESDTIMQGEEGNEVGPAESDTIMQGEEGNEVRPAESDTIMQEEHGNEVGPVESDTIMQEEEGNEVGPAESDTIMQEEEGNEVGPAESDTIMQEELGNEVKPIESDKIVQGEEGNKENQTESEKKIKWKVDFVARLSLTLFYAFFCVLFWQVVPNHTLGIFSFTGIVLICFSVIVLLPLGVFLSKNFAAKKELTPIEDWLN